MSTLETCVVGAGPAGSAAAIELAAAGVETVMLDKSHFPRDKTCGDGLTTLALRWLRELGLSPATVPSWTPISATVVHPPTGEAVRLDLPDDGRAYAAIARRSELDEALIRLASQAGARVHLGVAATKITPSGDHVIVECGDGSSLRARHVVVATGATGLAPTSHDMHATRVYMSAPATLPPDVHVWFDPESLPGYAWLFPIGNGAANVGVAIHRRNRSPRYAVDATHRLMTGDRFRQVAGNGAIATDRLRSWRIPSTLAVRRSADRIMYVGDAAGAGDPMTGEGIGQALRSGSLAARAIVATRPEDRDAAPDYRRAALNAFFADHLAARLALRALARERTATAAVRFIGSGPRLRSYFARWMWEDVARSSVVSPLAFARSLRAPRGVAFDR